MKRYLSLILLLALMLGIFGVSYAQTTVTIGDGTAYTYEPFNVLWGYCRSIGLYTFDQIGQPGQITSLGWNVGSTGTASVPYKIYAKLTTDPAQTAGTWADFVATATLLKQGTYIFNTSGWHTFTFDTPFAFSGGNLLIGVEATFGGTGASGCPQFCYTAGAAGIHQYWRQDSSAPTGNGTLNTILPNLQMTMMPLSDDPYLSLRPSGYDFGRVVINTTNSKTFTITNAGGGTLNVTGISPLSSGFFTLTDVPAWPVALTSGQSTTFNIQYAPTAVGNHDATFTITDGRATTNLTVSGECFDPVIYDFPWLEEFTDTTFPPLDWSRYVGLYPADALTPIDFKWVRTNFANVGNPANPSARINIWGDATKHWLVTPPIAIPATGYQLDFNLALTKYSNSNPVDPTLQQDDKFIVFIADNQTMVNPTILREWNNADSPYVYNNITTLGEYQVIDLSAHVGTKYIAFYGESTASGGDNDLFVDNVRVRESPTTPILTYTPDALNFGTGFANTPMAYRNVTVSNTGGGTLDLPIANVSIVGEDAAMFEFDPVNLPFALTVGQGGIIPVRYNPTAAGTHSATLRMVYAGENYDVALSGRALSESALFESFESTIYPPAGWQTTWTRNTSYAVHGGASAYRYGSTTAQHLLSTPMLTIVDDSTLDFWIRCGSTNGVIEVLYSPDRENWTQIGENITFAVGGTWYNHVIDLSSLAGNNYYLALRTGLIGTGYYADMFIGPDITPLVPGTPVLASPADAATNVVTTPTFTWTAPATGGVPTSYNIYCDTNETPTTLVGTSTTLSFTLDTPLSYSTTYYWTVTAENAEGESVPATPRSFTTIADPTVYTYPFVEGFEVGQTQGALVLGWLNYRDDNKSRDWLINSTNTTYNRTPRNGSYNATLMWNGNAWLMKPFSVEAGQSYDVEVWARQDGSTAANASVGLYYGTEGTIAGMTNTILTQTGIVNGDYQSIFGSFTPTADGICWIAIHGVINNSPYYISIDDILVQPTPTGPVFAYTPDTIDFGSVFYNTASAPVDVTVTNIGVGSLSLDASDISIVGPNAADFAFAATNLPASLAPNESVTIPVTVNSTTEGPISATLRMVYDATNYDVALSANVYSQSVLTIGDGTSYNNTSTYPAVYGAWYKNAREQYILTAAELNAAGAQAGIINTIGFNVHTPNSAANLPNFKISMGTTTASEFTDTTFLTGLAEVYSVATYTPVAGWNAHNLDTPFYWDGTSNIVIQTSFGMLASYSNNASTYYTSTEPAYRAMFYRNDSTAWDTVTTATD
ncbi:MAG TPA: choice-of-anchor D domain-containing protein, partial [Candidatus Cloacimonadota bacterium]|nr:choice-of-anchor D domain-containing protein [Candidatus Cloacimonadota bacterium]